MNCMYPKKAGHGHASGYGKKVATKVAGYKRYTNGVQVKKVETGMYDMQNKFTDRPEDTAVNLYGKSGSSTAARHPDRYDITRPITRYRSIRP